MMVQLKCMAVSAPLKSKSSLNRSVKFILYMQFEVASALVSAVQVQRQDTRKIIELCPKLTIKRVEIRSGVFIANFE